MPNIPPKSAPDAARTMMRDDRGAIMVMGIFMCVFLVGALWYIAGIGDALVFRERMQESADSVAFSAAVIEARGMNIIVMMNLLMAAILAIRVAINLLKVVFIAAAAIFTALSLNPFGGEFFIPFIDPAVAGAEEMQSLDNSTRTPIDDALEALNVAETGVAEATPAGAWAGAFEMASKYTPPVADVILLGATTGKDWGLPVEKGTTHKLCEKSADAVADIITALIPNIPPGLRGAVKGVIGGMTSNDFFCELGDGGSPPDFSNQINAANSQACDGKKTKTCNDAADANTKYTNLQTKYGYVDGSPGPGTTTAQITEVNNAQKDWIAQQNACDDFDMDKCNKDVKKEQDKKAKEASDKAKAAGGGSSGSSGDKRPSMVAKNWHNGIADAQIASVTHSNDERNNTRHAPRYVNIADQKRRTINDANFVQKSAWAQAEFFYDCGGAWSSCNNNQEAMWNFHWRARFRLVNGDAYLGGEAISVADAAMRAKIGIDLATSKAESWGLTNGVQKAELGKVAAETGTPFTLH